jgi:hypothetical protein
LVSILRQYREPAKMSHEVSSYTVRAAPGVARFAGSSALR